MITAFSINDHSLFFADVRDAESYVRAACLDRAKMTIDYYSPRYDAYNADIARACKASGRQGLYRLYISAGGRLPRARGFHVYHLPGLVKGVID